MRGERVMARLILERFGFAFSFISRTLAFFSRCPLGGFFLLGFYALLSAFFTLPFFHRKTQVLDGLLRSSALFFWR